MKFVLMIVAMLALPSLALADDEPDQPPTGSVALLCKMSRHAMTTTQTLSLDYDQKLVNGMPAIFTQSMITWTVHNGSEIEHHELNRLTGTYDYWTDGKNSAEPMPTFVCLKQAEKF